MLNNQELAELNNFLNRLQGQTVRLEFCSRLNIGFRMSFAVKLEKSSDSFQLTSESGEVSMFFDPAQVESFSSDHTSVSLLYGDNLVSIRYARTR